MSYELPEDLVRFLRNPGHLPSVERAASAGAGSFEDYFPETAAGEYVVHDEDDLYYGRNVIWDGQSGKMLKADPDYIRHIFGNIFDADKLAAIIEGINDAEDRVTFEAPYGTASKIGLQEVKESIQYADDEGLDRPYTTGDDDLDAYLVDPEEALLDIADPDEEPEEYAEAKAELEEALLDAVENDEGDLGEWAVTIRDGNHRAFGALLAGEPYVWVMISKNQYTGYQQGLQPELEEVLE